jgi:hypothetical protein
LGWRFSFDTFTIFARVELQIQIHLNMNTELWHNRFMEILLEKFPKKAELVEALHELLHIERPAVYRRMRSEVPFTAGEVAMIASAWNISLDDIMGIYSGKVAFQMFPFNYLNPSKNDIENLKKKGPQPSASRSPVRLRVYGGLQ